MKTKLFLVLSFFVMQFSNAFTAVLTDPVTPVLPPLAYCDPNSDGVGFFDLTQQIPLITAAQTGNPSDYFVTFHETLIDANMGGISIPLPTGYSNINPYSQTIYYRVFVATTGAFAIGDFQIIVNSAPVATAPSNISLCDTNNDGIENFNLMPIIPEVLGGMNPSQVTVTFHTSLVAAEVGMLPITASGAYASSSQTLYARATMNDTGCYDVVSFQLIVNPRPVVTTPTPLDVCDADANPNNQFTVFDLTVKNIEITQGNPGYIVTYYPSFSNAVSGTNPIVNPSVYFNVAASVQTLGVAVTNAATGCVSYITLDIRVMPIPTPNTNPPALAPQCDVNLPGDMLEVFDLTVNEAYLRNGDPTLTFHYFYTMADAQNNVNESVTPTAALVGSNVWVRVENNRVDYHNNHCYVLVEQPLRVNPLPTVIQPLPPYRVCDTDADGIAQFDLTNPQLAQMILGSSQSPTGFSITYHLTAANAATGIAPLPSPYTNMTSFTQNIYIRVVNNATGCVNATGQLTLAVQAGARATGPQTFLTCDDYLDPFDGIIRVDLTQFAPEILNGQNPAIFQLSYYTSQADAAQATNALTLSQSIAYVTNPDSDTVWVRVDNTSNSITPSCFAITTINISVNRYPNPIITAEGGFNTVYVDNANNVTRPLLLDSGMNGNYTYQWYLDNGQIAVGNASTYQVNSASANNQSRNYSVLVTNNNPTGCSWVSATYMVLQSNGVPPPSGALSQTFPPGATLANIVVSGTNIQWYSSATNRTVLAIPLPMNTVLVDGMTYYASQTINGVESPERFPVTVHVTLGVNNPEVLSLSYAPNPVKNSLSLQSANVLKKVSVYTLLGQKVLEQHCNSPDVTLDLSSLATGSYLLKIQDDTNQKTIRILKQ